jgi:hypothetical protein
MSTKIWIWVRHDTTSAPNPQRSLARDLGSYKNRDNTALHSKIEETISTHAKQRGGNFRLGMDRLPLFRSSGRQPAGQNMMLALLALMVADGAHGVLNCYLDKG